MNNINFVSPNQSVGFSFSHSMNGTIEWTGRFVRDLRVIPSSMNRSSTMTVTLIAAVNILIYTFIDSIVNRLEQIDQIYEDKVQLKERSIIYISIREGITGISVFLVNLLLARSLEVKLNALVYFCIIVASVLTIAIRLVKSHKSDGVKKEIEIKNKEIENLKGEIEVLNIDAKLKENGNPPWKPSSQSYFTIAEVTKAPKTLNKKKALEIFGLNQGAPLDEIKKTKKLLSFFFHPDRNPDQGYSQAFTIVKDAYEVIIDPKKN